MAINFEDVCRASTSLLTRGVRPTIDSVRVELGNTGSNSTIGPYLDRFWNEALPVMLSNRFRRDDWPEEMNGLINEMLDRVMTLAHGTAQGQFDADKMRAAASVREAESAREAAERDAAKNKEELTETRGELALANATIDDLRNQLRGKDILLEAKNDLLAEYESRLASFEVARQEMVARTEALIQSERDRQEEMYKGLQQALMMNVDRERALFQERLDDYRLRLDAAQTDKKIAEQRLMTSSTLAAERQRTLEDRVLVLEEKNKDCQLRLEQSAQNLADVELRLKQSQASLVLWKRRARAIEHG